MSTPDFVLLVLAAIAGIAAAAGGIVIAFKTPRYAAARAAFWIAAICVFLVGVSWGVTAEHSSMIARYTGAGITAAIAAMGLVWILTHLHEEREVAPQSEKKDPAILVECHAGVMPTTPERIFVLNLWPTPQENGGGGLMEYYSFDERKGERIWPKTKSGMPQQAYKCQLTNYDSATLFGVAISMQFKFLNVVRDGNSSHSGNVFLEREYPISITKIDPTAPGAFTFYIFNTSDKFVSVTFPQFGTATQLSDERPKKVKLIQPFNGFEMSFVPYEPAPPETPNEAKK